MRPTANQPRYAMLAAALKQQIQEGKFPVGSMMPTEATLCEQFCVSRHTVREALRQLHQQGLIACKQGSGTQVIASSPQQSQFVHLMDSFADCLTIRMHFTPHLLDTSLQPFEIEHAKYYAEDSKRLWLRFQILWIWTKDDLPSVITDIYVDAKFCGIQNEYNAREPLTTVLERVYGIKVTKTQENFQAVLLNEKQRELLQAKSNTPGLLCLRRFLSDHNELIGISFNLAHGDRYSYSHTLSA